MRELLSLRRNEAPIIGEVYIYENEYLKCVVDSSSWCENCFFDAENCGKLCDKKDRALPRRHFERVLESELETAADVKFRHIEETKGAPPLLGERFIAAVGLVEFVEKQNPSLCSCAQCDLTQRECDVAGCGVSRHYKRVKQ